MIGLFGPLILSFMYLLELNSPVIRTLLAKNAYGPSEVPIPVED